jgi:Predicted membrane protein
MKNKSLIRVSVMGIFSALSIVLIYFIHLPIFPAVSFLEYDPADIPIIICSYLFGPFYGLGMAVAVSIIQGLTVSAQSGWIGVVMHIFATGSLVYANSGLRLLLRKRLTATETAHSVRRTAVIDIASALAGIAAMTVSMTLWNLLFTPIFMGVTLDFVLPLIPFIILFNIIKASLNSFAALAIFKLLPKKLISNF